MSNITNLYDFKHFIQSIKIIPENVYSQKSLHVKFFFLNREALAFKNASQIKDYVSKYDSGQIREIKPVKCQMHMIQCIVYAV